MNDEPIYIKQDSAAKTSDQRDDWFKDQVIKAKVCGATWCRFSYHPDDDNRVIIEGWRLRPKREGAIRWHASDTEPATPAPVS